MDNNANYNDKVSAIILAAGLSSRMGDLKPLLEIGGQSAISHLLDQITKAGIRDVIVVTGHKSEEITRAVTVYKSRDMISRGGIRTVYNEQYKTGMFSSIATGVRGIYGDGLDTHSERSGVLVFPADVPLITSDIIRQVISARDWHEDYFIVPCYKGKKGHPLCIPSVCYEEIINSAQDFGDGMRSVMKVHKDKIRKVDVASEAVVIDMDTQEAYSEAKAWAADELSGKHAADALLYAGKESKIFRLIAEYEERGGKVFLMRHGHIRQHKSAMFLGQSDVPLSNLGREKVRAAASLMANTGKIYTSDLKRAVESAEILAEELDISGYPKFELVPELREISLGQWDGRYLDDIREEYPEEFAARGKDMIDWKESGGENFYDLSYRVLKKFVKILEQAVAGQDNGDILIVSHAGPIRMILAEYKGIPIKEALDIEVPYAVPQRVDGTAW